MIPRRLANAKPQASLTGNLHALAILVRACAIGSGRVTVCAVGDDVHVVSAHRPLACYVESKAAGTIVGIYDQRAQAGDILDDLRFAAMETRHAA